MHHPNHLVPTLEAPLHSLSSKSTGAHVQVHQEALLHVKAALLDTQAMEWGPIFLPDLSTGSTHLPFIHLLYMQVSCLHRV